MIAQLVALGLFAAEPESFGEVSVPAERTAVMAKVQSTAVTSDTIPLGAAEWEQPFDPADHAPYAADFSPLLGENERIARIVRIRSSATAAALGIKIDDAPAYAPIIDEADGKKVQVWPVVDPDLEEADPFLAAGVRIPVATQIETNSNPPKRFERTSVLRVRQL